MGKGLLEILYEQIMFFSENGTSNIESPNFMAQETHKYSGVPKKEVIELFIQLVQIGFIEKVPTEKYAYRVKEHLSLINVKKLIH